MCVIVLGNEIFDFPPDEKHIRLESPESIFNSNFCFLFFFFLLADWIFFASFLMDVYDSLFVQYFYVTEDDITQLTSPTPGGPNFPADVPPLGHR